MEATLHDPAFWVAVGFALFVLAVSRPALRFAVNALDERANRIAEELSRAVQLREQAENLLAEYQTKYEQAVAEAQEIVKNAEEDANRYAAMMEQELKDSIEKRRQLAEQKIAQAEARALQEVKQHVVDITISAAREVITQRLQTGQSDGIAALAATELHGKLH